LVAGGARVIELDVEADADEVLVVAEEALGDAFCVRTERGGELEMNPANDNFGG
jgi:glycerophosphoryl diester phosphodiesterase